MNQKILQLIEEGVSRGATHDFIKQSLLKAGYKREDIESNFNYWLKATGREQVHADFKTWIGRYYRQSSFAIAVLVILNVAYSILTILRPWPAKILAGLSAEREPSGTMAAAIPRQTAVNPSDNAHNCCPLPRNTGVHGHTRF